MNKFSWIFGLLIALVSVSGHAKSEESNKGLWKSKDCIKVSEAAGLFLYVSGEALKTADRKRKTGNEEGSQESYEAALFWSDLSANAATNFETFCKK